MAIDWKPIAEGDQFNADSLNDRFTEIHGEINELPQTSVEMRSLNRDHLPTAIIKKGNSFSSADVLIQTGMGFVGFRWPGWPIDYNAAASLGTGLWADPAPHNVDVGSTAEGWRILATHNFDPDLVFAPTGTPLEPVNGLLMMANVYVSGLYTKNKFNRTGATNHLTGFVAFALENSAGGFHIIPTSIRYIDSDTNTNNGHDVVNPEKYGIITSESAAGEQVHALTTVAKDIPIRAYVTPSDFTDPTGAGSWVFNKAHLITCVNNSSATYTDSVYRTKMVVSGHEFTVLGLHAANTTRSANLWGTD